MVTCMCKKKKKPGDAVGDLQKKKITVNYIMSDVRVKKQYVNELWVCAICLTRPL